MYTHAKRSHTHVKDPAVYVRVRRIIETQRVFKLLDTKLTAEEKTREEGKTEEETVLGL